jgi:arsenate reductase-like glutaredoxin family protein
MDVQVFGVMNDADTRKALRFFKERRVKVHFVDFKVRGPSRGELRRFVQKLGADAVLDRGSKRFRALGLQSAHYGEERWLEIAEAEPLILRMPLVRHENRVTAGPAEAAWREWVGA